MVVLALGRVSVPLAAWRSLRVDRFRGFSATPHLSITDRNWGLSETFRPFATSLSACASPTEATRQGPDDGPPRVLKNIVVAVDTTNDSLMALDWAMKHLYRHGTSKLTLLHVLPNIFQGPATGSIWFEEPTDRDVEDAIKQQCSDFFNENFISKVQQEFDQSLEIDLVLVDESETSDTGWAIVKAAERLMASPLVMGRHKHTGLHRLLPGSVATHCALHCHCPVLLIPPDTVPATPNS